MTDRRKPAGMPGSAQRADGDVHDLDDTARRERALELANDAARFVALHPDAWAFIEATLLREVEQGGRASLQRAVELARRRDFASFPTDATRVNNLVRPFLVRRFLLLHPTARGHLETRASLADELTPAEILGGVVA